MNYVDHDEICTFDDLTVVTLASGTVSLSCPACGDLGADTVHTLSDLTNAAIEHLERHPEALRHALGVAA